MRPFVCAFASRLPKLVYLSIFACLAVSAQNSSAQWASHPLVPFARHGHNRLISGYAITIQDPASSPSGRLAGSIRPIFRKYTVLIPWPATPAAPALPSRL